MVKIIRAYGGTARLYCTRPGWEWEYSRKFLKYKEPREITIGGKTFWIHGGGGHGFGGAVSLKRARRRAIGALKAMARA
jgi:hypothetical protein